MRTQNKKSGFTLVELMIVAAIIAILAAIIIPLMSKNKETAVAADGKNIAGAVMTAAKTYYARVGSWPTWAQLAADDTDLATDVGKTLWTVTALSGPDPAIVTVNTAGNQGYAGNVTLTDGVWSDTLAKL